MWRILNFGALNDISGTAEGWVVKLCTQLEYIKFYPWDDKIPPNGRGQGHVTYMLNFWASVVWSESMKLGSTNVVCWLIQRSTSACVIDYPRKGCFQGHATFKFREIGNNILEKARDRHGCNGRPIGNHMWPVEWHHYWLPLVTLKVTFAVSNLSVSHTLRISACYILFVDTWIRKHT